jgi:hypothetical protein
MSVHEQTQTFTTLQVAAWAHKEQQHVRVQGWNNGCQVFLSTLF